MVFKKNCKDDITNHWREIFDPAAQIFLNLNVIPCVYKYYLGSEMNKMEMWKNFDLGTELDVSGCFIYNGLKSLHEIETLHYSSDIFEME